MGKFDVAVLTVAGLGLLLCTIWVIYWLNWRDWFHCATERTEDYIDRMRKFRLPFSVQLTAEIILAWFRERMELAGFYVTSDRPFELLDGGLGLEFHHSQRKDVSIFVHKLNSDVPGGVTKITIQFRNSRMELESFQYEVRNDPLQPHTATFAARGRALSQRNNMLCFITEHVLGIHNTVSTATILPSSAHLNESAPPP